MKRYFLLLLGFLLSLVSIASGQVIQVSGDTVINHSINDGEIAAAKFMIRNMRSTPINLKCRRILNQLAEGHESYFCWDICYSPMVSASLDYITVPANGMNDQFYSDLKHFGKPGISKVGYEIFSTTNPNEVLARVMIEYRINTTTGLGKSLQVKPELSTPYPNPAAEATRIETRLPAGVERATLKIYDFLGKEVRSINVRGGNSSHIIEVNNLESGIYFFSLQIDAKPVATRRFVVNH